MLSLFRSIRREILIPKICRKYVRELRKSRQGLQSIRQSWNAFSEVEFDVNDASRVIYVTLPAPTVISHSIDTSSFFLPDQAQRSFHGDLSGRVHRGTRLHLLRAGGCRDQVRQGLPPCVGDRQADCHRFAQGGIRHCRLHAPLLHRILTHGQPLGAAFLRIRLGMCKIMHILFLTIYL